MSSTPSFSQFDPTVIPFQIDVINDVYHNFDYDDGVHELLFSGTVGSSKSLLAAHLAVRHCVENPGAVVMLGRNALPDIKETIYLKICQHIQGAFVDGKHYHRTDNTAKIRWANGSKIISRSWADKNYEKFRSLELSMAIIEEITENESLEDMTFYFEILSRVGRLNNVKQNLVLSLTNPGSPSSKIYEYFFVKKKETRKVYFSHAKDNPYIPRSYLRDLEDNLDPVMADRLLKGLWVEARKDVIYHTYNQELHGRSYNYDVNPKFPIHLSFDWNIAVGKPMSACAFQFIDDVFHFFTEWIIEGADTEEMAYEMMASEHLTYKTNYIVNGDATGKARSTMSKRSNYDIIEEYFSNNRNLKNEKIDFSIEVPQSNPPVRERHNIVNAYMKSSSGKVRLVVYQGCPTLAKGFRTVKLKKGGSYVELETWEQHVTTAAGYGIMWAHEQKRFGTQSFSKRIR